jgi:DNA polymerase-3 subunit alpha
VAKYLNWDPSSVIALIPDRVGITVDEALKESKELEKEITRNRTAKEALRLCKLLEGRPRVISPHPSGIILTPNPTVTYAPLASYGDDTLTQYSMDTCAKLGLLKIDFLGIKYLTVIKKAKKLIKERYSSVYDTIPPHDEKVYEMLGKGYSLGLFQLESDGMKELLKRIAPKNLKELCDVISLYRPGPKKYIDSYIKGKNNPENVTYPIEQIKPALEETYGCPIYQEQIMKICTDAAGFTLGHADTVRRAMAKKKSDQMNAEKESFIKGCEKNGIDKGKAAFVFDQISGFAKYAFNKSHGAAYALLAYETAYLKFIYPAEYFSAKLESEGGHQKYSEYFYEMVKLNVSLKPPCINHSEVEFVPEENGVRYSLSAIKGVGKPIAEAIIKERKKFGPFENADNFISRLGGTIGKNAAVALARSGALDAFGETRHTMSTLCEETFSSNIFSQVSDDQITLSFDNDQSVKYLKKKEKEYTETELRFFEKEYTGVDFHFSPGQIIKENQTNNFVLYIKLTPDNKKVLPIALKTFSKTATGSVVRIYDSQSGKTSELKDAFFTPCDSALETLEKIMGKDNVKLKALERNKQ